MAATGTIGGRLRLSFRLAAACAATLILAGVGAIAQTAPPTPGASLKLPPRPPASAAFRTLPAADATDLSETTQDGLRLPKISASGWMPWIAHARRYDPTGPLPRIGLTMINVGGDEALMQRAIDDLPGEVSLAFLPGTPDLPVWLRRARDRGHEVYLMLPTEDPGGIAERGIRPIEAAAGSTENLKRLRSTMARGESYVGFVVPGPGPASRSRLAMQPLIQELADRGLAIVEISPGLGTSNIYRLTADLGVGYARSSMVLDNKLSSQSLDIGLDRLVNWVSHPEPDGRARHAFGVVQPDSQTIDIIAAWRNRFRGNTAVSLVPIIGHFECRGVCIERVRSQPQQMRP